MKRLYPVISGKVAKRDYHKKVAQFSQWETQMIGQNEKRRQMQVAANAQKVQTEQAQAAGEPTPKDKLYEAVHKKLGE